MSLFYKDLMPKHGKVLLLLCALLFQQSFAFARIDLQKVPCSLSVQNIPLEEVFEMIEKQTHYSIVCMDQTGLMSRKVNVYAPNATLEKVVQLLATQATFNYKCLDNNIIIRSSVAVPVIEPV